MIIVIMEELVTIKIVTVIMMSYSQNSAEINKMTWLRNWQGKHV